MPRKPQRPASRGSQRWLQTLVNEHPTLLSEALASRLKLEDPAMVRWLSPLAQDDYAEYRDQAFLERLGLGAHASALMDFWPRGGPVWDGLGLTERGDLLLIEAKAHLGEQDSDPCGATAPASLLRIQESLAATSRFLRVEGEADWTRTFYQYANRLAHLYFLRQVLGLPAHLVMLYFINAVEVGGPATQRAWEEARTAMYVALGLGEHPLSSYVHDVFSDVRALGASAEEQELGNG